MPKDIPALRATAMRDFFEILNKEGVYNPELHNKSEGTYQLWGNLVEFISVDQPQKVRGRKREILFINEANELSLEDWRQLMLRTTDRVIIDFNPSDEFHWIYEQVIPREDADFFQTTYKDNPFLPESVVMEIERFKDVDENFWRVYGLGERGTSQATIFTHWKEIDQIPNEYKLLTTGLDFGYTNDPTAVVRIYTDGHGFAVDEICYATRLTNSDIAKMLRDNGVHRSDVVICDSAEPKSIDEIHAHGFNTHGARKGRDSIRSGISFLHSRPLAVTSRSVNLIRELRNYKWKEDKNGKQLNEPVDSFNHAIDAMRYGITWNQTNPNFGSYAIG
jgi:phage terminase large subunit